MRWARALLLRVAEGAQALELLGRRRGGAGLAAETLAQLLDALPVRGDLVGVSGGDVPLLARIVREVEQHGLVPPAVPDALPAPAPVGAEELLGQEQLVGREVGGQLSVDAGETPD